MTLRMKADVRDLWADALESGKYAQTKGVLHRVDGGGFCCLGVLCDLAVQAGVIPEPEVTSTDDDGSDVYTYGASDDYSYTGLPAAVIEWAGVYDDDDEDTHLSDPKLTNALGQTEHAAGWNDSEGASFTDIAAMVRLIEPAEVLADA